MTQCIPSISTHETLWPMIIKVEALLHKLIFNILRKRNVSGRLCVHYRVWPQVTSHPHWRIPDPPAFSPYHFLSLYLSHSESSYSLDTKPWDPLWPQAARFLPALSPQSCPQSFALSTASPWLVWTPWVATLPREPLINLTSFHNLEL